jgi:hypothetical protein
VVLDIGPGAGAAIVMTPDALNGTEIEIRKTERSWDGTHVAVRRRDGDGSTRYAAIFGSLSAGRYEFRLRPGGSGDRPALVADVAEASVTVVHWPEDGAPESQPTVSEARARLEHAPSSDG